MNDRDQTIFRVGHHYNRPYSMLANGMLQDDRLSIEARGLLSSIMSRPPGWRLNYAWVQAAHKIGRDKAYRLVKELTDAGYCMRDQKRLSSGRMGAIEYHFTDCPELYAKQRNSPDPENQEAVKYVEKSTKPAEASPLPDLPDPVQPDPAFQGPLERNDSLENLDSEKVATERGETAKADSASVGRAGSGKGKGKPKLANPAQGRIPETPEQADDAERKRQEARERVDKAKVAFRAFIALAEEIGLDVPVALTHQRRQKLENLLGMFPGRSTAWAEALALVRASPFLRGQNSSGWRVTFDKLIDQEFFVKLFEGKYAATPSLVTKPVAVRPPETVDRPLWEQRLRVWNRKDRSVWPKEWGPAPGAEGCFVPADLVEREGIKPAA